MPIDLYLFNSLQINEDNVLNNYILSRQFEKKVIAKFYLVRMKLYWLKRSLTPFELVILFEIKIFICNIVWWMHGTQVIKVIAKSFDWWKWNFEVTEIFAAKIPTTREAGLVFFNSYFKPKKIENGISIAFPSFWSFRIVFPMRTD